jgi:hypothetical protein
MVVPSIESGNPISQNLALFSSHPVRIIGGNRTPFHTHEDAVILVQPNGIIKLPEADHEDTK